MTRNLGISASPPCHQKRRTSAGFWPTVIAFDMRLPATDAARLQPWNALFAGLPNETRQALSKLVVRQASALADEFYAAMMADGKASQMLSHSLVSERLHASMARWLCTLFDPACPAEDIVAVQQRTGEVHARIGVPMDMVARGARVLKRSLCRQLTLSDMPREALADTVQYLHELIDLALDDMGQAFTDSSNRLLRSDEAYRLFFIGQNMKAERERRRSELLEWAHQIFQRYYWNAQNDAAAAAADVFRGSPFGLWLRHKASLLFEGAEEVAQIEALVAGIEGDLLPRLSRMRDRHDDARSVVAAINHSVDTIKTLLGSMFDRFIAVEDGRDGVARLLNRRYVASVARREIEVAQRQGTRFAMLMIDVDHFKVINLSVGQEAGDLILAQLADALIDRLRAGDFVFRVGDDQFLVLLVEADESVAVPVSEGLCRDLAALRLRTGAQVNTSLTVSIGIAVFDGHPDYQHLLDAAEAALRKAKLAGRNRCELAR